MRKTQILHAVLASERRRACALVARDIGALDGCFHDDLIYVHATGVRHGKSELLQFLASPEAPRFLAVHLVRPQTCQVGRGALLNGDMHMTLQRADATPMQTVSWVSALWIRLGTDDAWQLRLFQSTRVAA